MQTRKRRFTDQEFDIMVEQLTVQKPASFDMLCEIADRTLHGWVISECNNNEDLRGRQLDEDIYHDVILRLIQKTVTNFLLNDSPHGEINRNPDGFKSWMFTVAGNLISDTATKVRNHDFRCRGFLEDEEDNIEDGDNQIENGSLFISQERLELLKCATSIVLDSKSQPYIVLTWLAMCVFVLNFGITKIESNHKILDIFFDKNLFDMFDMLNIASKKIPWLAITEEQSNRMTQKLCKKNDDGRTYGETSYREFFMKKAPLSTISDWENRMNSLVKRVMKNETSDR